MRRMFTVAGLIAITSTTVAFASGPPNWKVYGLAKFPTEVVLFYLNSEITRTPGHVQVWMKALDSKKLDSINKFDKSRVMNKALKLVASYYVPPLALVEDLDVDHAMIAIRNEQIADVGAIRPTLRVLYEIDCLQKLTRTLSIIGMKPSRFDNLVGNWEHIPPESTIETLSKLTCTPT